MSDFNTKTPAELKKLLVDKKVALRDFRFGIAGSKARNVREGRVLRRDVARILTILNKKTA